MRTEHLFRFLINIRDVVNNQSDVMLHDKEERGVVIFVLLSIVIFSETNEQRDEH